MADQRNFARTVMAFSSAVVAVCAVTLTIKVLTMDALPVEATRVLDQDALERQVAEEVDGEVDSVACPVSVVVAVGAEFDCRVWAGSNPTTVFVKIISEQGDLSVQTSR